MLGESLEAEQAAERARWRRRLLHLCTPPLMLRFRPDVAARQFDRMLTRSEPRRNPWNPYRELERAAWWMWRCVLGLQRQYRLQDATNLTGASP